MLSLTACETTEPECYEPTIVNVNSWFQVRDTVITYNQDSTEVIKTLQTQDTILKTPAFLALDLDTIHYGVLGNTTRVIGVALNPATEQMRYKVLADTSIATADTITFFYQTKLHFISNNCGYTNYFSLDSVHITRNIFDSAVLADINVTSTVTTKNVFLYLRK